jgi:hypothetical protein
MRRPDASDLTDYVAKRWLNLPGDEQVRRLTTKAKFSAAASVGLLGSNGGFSRRGLAYAFAEAASD